MVAVNFDAPAVNFDDVGYSFDGEPDVVAPTVVNVTSAHADGTFGVGEVIDITVQFTEVVIVVGTPRLVLQLTPARTINYLSGSGTNTLTFRYIVASPDSTLDLDYRDINSLQANGTIKDGAGNNATLTLPAPGAAGSLGANKAIVIATPALPGGVGTGLGFSSFWGKWGFGLS